MESGLVKLEKLLKEVHHTYPLENNLRFELADPLAEEQSQSLNQAFFRGKAIFQDVFKPTDTIILVLFVVKNWKKAHLQRFFKSNDFHIVGSFSTNSFASYYDEPLEVIYISTKVANLLSVKLLKGQVYTDFPDYDATIAKVRHRNYFYQPAAEILLNIYDDRGCDLWSPSKKVMKPYYHKFLSWLLPYDLEAIDKSFA